MDYENRGGHKTGSGALASSQDVAIERRERLRRLALESIDLSKDPYYMKNHLGQVECRLCSTIHTNEGSYLSHTQGRKHQTSLAYRASKEKNSKPVIKLSTESSEGNLSVISQNIGRVPPELIVSTANSTSVRFLKTIIRDTE
ncbi:putative splicing factor 3A subunit 2 [Cryptosporidium felis]|nr:putative splicing factor 3A subunit 2 [Cryptosporidium felis]